MRVRDEHIQPIIDDLKFIGAEEHNETALRMLVSLGLWDPESSNPFSGLMLYHTLEKQLDELERLGQWWTSFKQRYDE